MKDLPKTQLICFALILLVCMLGIGEAVYYVFNPPKQKEKKEATNTVNMTVADDAIALKNGFQAIFQNQFNNSNNSVAAEKMDNTKDYVYVDYAKTETIQGKYNISVTIPKININSEQIKTYNKAIEQSFIAKAESVQKGNSNDVVYTVKYQAFLNNNILSVVIDATLKEGKNANQRELVQSYCYNVETMKEVKFSDILKIKGIDEQTAKQKIKVQIQAAQENAKQLQAIGYVGYQRDLRGDNYEVSNVKNFFITNENKVYIIYAYGNKENTDEMDIVTF